MKKWNVMMMAVLVSVMTMGCGSAQKSVSVADLAGEWEIIEVKGQPVTSEEIPFLGFNVVEKQLYGNAGCNSLMGTLETQEDKKEALSFGAVGSTKRMCADMAAEDAILQALGDVKTFALEEGKLMLKDANGEELIELKKRP